MSLEAIGCEPNQAVIDCLKDLVRMAEEGNILCFTTVYLTSKNESGRSTAGKFDYDRMIGLLEMGKHDLLMASAEESRTVPLGEDT